MEAGPSLMSRRGVKHLIKQAIGREAASITAEAAVDAVQACSSEFINLVVSEARQRVAREGRALVTETDLLAVLSQMGFRGFDEPLKTYLRECEADDRSSKRLRTTPTQEGQGAAVADAAGSANAGVAKGAGLADGGVNAAPVVRSAEAEVSAAIPERAGLVHVGMSTAEGAGSADAGVTAAEMKGADCSADAGVNTAATEGAAGSAETRMDAATKSS